MQSHVKSDYLEDRITTTTTINKNNLCHFYIGVVIHISFILCRCGCTRYLLPLELYWPCLHFGGSDPPPPHPRVQRWKVLPSSEVSQRLKIFPLLYDQCRQLNDHTHSRPMFCIQYQFKRIIRLCVHVSHIWACAVTHIKIYSLHCQWHEFRNP